MDPSLFSPFHWKDPGRGLGPYREKYPLPQTYPEWPLKTKRLGPGEKEPGGIPISTRVQPAWKKVKNYAFDPGSNLDLRALPPTFSLPGAPNWFRAKFRVFGRV